MSATYQKAEERIGGVGQLAVGQIHEVREDMSLQVVYLHHRNVICNGQSFGKRCTHQQRAEQSRASREGYGVDFIGRNASLLEGCIYHGDDVLLVRTRGELGYHTAIFYVHGLRGNYVRQKCRVAYYGSRCIVARGLDAKNCYIHMSAFMRFFSIFNRKMLHL